MAAYKDYRIAHPMKHGFTLIELSMVLVIIGLIVGGVLVGRDLIKAAQIRATIKQFEEFNTAVNAFRTKFNCLPGDCRNASSFGFHPDYNGNGDGTIGYCNIPGGNIDCGTSPHPVNANYDVGGEEEEAEIEYYEIGWMERFGMWYHLSAAGMLAVAPSSRTPGAMSDGVPGVDYPVFTPPKSKISARIVGIPNGGRPHRSGWWQVAANIIYGCELPGCPPGYRFLPKHNFVLGSVFSWATYYPYDLWMIDIKMDDGLPLSGTVLMYHRVNSPTGMVSPRHESHWMVMDGSAYVGVVDGDPPRYDLAPPETYPSTHRVIGAGLIIKATF